MSVTLQNTHDELSNAAQTKSVEHGQQEAPVLRTDSLATSSLIYSALEKGIYDETTDEGKTMEGMRKMAQRLSKNTLSTWYKGALLTSGKEDEIKAVWGVDFAAQCYNPTTKEMTPWLRELRRSYGNTWEGCMAAAKFLEEYQNSKLRTEMFATIPSLSALDDDGVSVKGWAGINVKGTSGNSLFASTGRVNTIEGKLKAAGVVGF